MKKLILPILLSLAACTSNPKEKKATDTTKHVSITSTKVTPAKPAPEHTDTLQFIHFDGNGDYWDAFFINAQKDTLRLVTDEELTDKLLGKLLQVKWRTDTLSSAGDGERPYEDKRLTGFKELPGKPFAKPLTEQMALQAVKDLEEIKSNADRVNVSEKPTADKRYYQVETSTEADGHLSRFQTFRVYFYPQYEIKVYNPADETEMSLEAWRKSQ
ncbi:hypothetical protein [Mucilaginibacter terrae]|uniref:Lipoprotein n=1 Tax=Mucilaginibacter terrae TaxID=1955052 RepID=A0ABU3GRU0_9SPHI|nr:hypothetical protein [Mucilaginibacter terrae]MDT3402493.1 hypothetical protein [Mucilaginibacter terrae]